MVGSIFSIDADRMTAKCNANKRCSFEIDIRRKQVKPMNNVIHDTIASELIEHKDRFIGYKNQLMFLTNKNQSGIVGQDLLSEISEQLNIVNFGIDEFDEVMIIK